MIFGGFDIWRFWTLVVAALADLKFGVYDIYPRNLVNDLVNVVPRVSLHSFLDTEGGTRSLEDSAFQMS